MCLITTVTGLVFTCDLPHWNRILFIFIFKYSACKLKQYFWRKVNNSDKIPPSWCLVWLGTGHRLTNSCFTFLSIYPFICFSTLSLFYSVLYYRRNPKNKLINNKMFGSITQYVVDDVADNYRPTTVGGGRWLTREPALRSAFGYISWDPSLLWN